MAARPLPNFLPGTCCIDLLTIPFCGHTSIAATCSGARLLLSLCRISRPPRVCEVVRFKAIRFPLAANEVRKATHAFSGS
jgi:hypothetical protein